MELLSQTHNNLPDLLRKEKQPVIVEDGDGATAFRYHALQHNPRSKEFRLLEILPARAQGSCPTSG
jgi:hypothetical protein